MVFSSLFFIFLFLPLNLLTYYIAKNNNTRNVIMLIFSLVFYAWGEPKYVFLLLFMTLSCWFFALLIDKYKKEDNTKNAKWSLFGATIIALGLIGVFKYSSFILTNFKAVTGFPETIPSISLPIGISFYTFQLLTYVIDVYRGDAVVQRKYSRLLLYASLFHQCIAGPIVRYSDIENQLTDRQPNFPDFNKGVMRFSSGLAKKVLIANACGSFSDTLLLSDAAMGNAENLAANIAELSSRTTVSLWLGVLFFTLQIYLDFSAYSDMAIGMGLMTGFHYRENFDYPYASTSVTEFWRRWHISLGSFFRDYVYIPMGGSRKGKVRTIINLFVVWALTGLWHGASWNFVLWGLYFFVFLMIEKLFLGNLLKKAPSAVGHMYLLLIVYFGWVLFKFQDMSLLTTALKGMFGLNGNGFASHEVWVYIKDNIGFIIIALFASAPTVKILKKIILYYSKNSSVINTIYSVFRAVIPAVLVIASAICLVGDSYNPFLYFQF